MDLGLEGKKALITGATKGIGRAIAERLLAEGAAVAICARTEGDVDSAVAELSSAGVVVGSVADAGDPESLKAWIERSAEALGGVDIYVHNTSAGPGGDAASWERSFNVDLMALIHGVEAAAPHLTASESGALISIGTTAALEHFGTGANNYSALKAAVTNWTLGQAQVLGAKGVRCNVVSPGPIFIEGGAWDFIKSNMEDFYNASVATHPARQMGSAEDVANVVAFLASPAARHVNGSNITVDGGFVKRVSY